MITLNSNALCTRNEVKDFLGLQAAGNDIDDFVNQTINRISTLFESYCHRKFMSASYTEYHDSDGDSWIFPKNTPVTVITAIYEDEDWDFGADTEIDSTEYKLADENSIFYDGVFTKGPQSLKIEYTGGYTSSTLPEDLKQAAIVEVARIIKHRTDFDILSVNRDDGTVTFTQFDFLPLTLKTLQNYKLIYAL